MAHVKKLNIVILFLFCACSTSTYIKDAKQLKNKRVAVAEIMLDSYLSKDKVKTDTLCTCIATSASEAIYPYLQKAGLTVIKLPLSGKLSSANVEKLADSLRLDYVVVGKGIVQFVGKSAFMRSLTLQIVNVKTLEVSASGTFSGPSVTPAGAAARIGKKLAGRIE